MDLEFTKWLATLGVGGTLAAFMFIVYRKDIKNYTELWKNTTDIIMSVVKENTASNTRLVEMIQNQERNLIRASDIKKMIQQGIHEVRGDDIS